MNVFIDTNILLDFFRLSRGDLDEVQKIIRLWKNQKLNLLISNYLKDEFYRNREKVISEALATFNKSTLTLHRPNLVRLHSESAELEQLQTKFSQLKQSLSDKVVEESKAGTTIADRVIADLFSATHLPNIEESTINKGLLRSNLGKPPGKVNSCGDAIHWEWLLAAVRNGEDLHVVSGDGDYESPLEEGALSNYLTDEWQKAKASNCYLYKTLADFLKAKFPTFRLADEDNKSAAIQKFENSLNFASTHNAIAALNRFDDFSKPQLRSLIKAFESNEQISWLLGDPDVLEFADKVIDLARQAGIEHDALPLEIMLADIEDQVDTK